MACEGVYRRVLGTSDVDAICDRFFQTVIPTNRTHAFFVDWQKIKNNVEALRFEIAILEALCGSEKVEDHLREALRREPRVAAVFPIIIAVRHQKMDVLDEGRDGTGLTPQHYDFTDTTQLSDQQIDTLVDFCLKTGIIALFRSLRIRSLRDYLLGVEVGMDTNARKNRSGTWMEKRVEHQLAVDQQRHPGAEIHRQRKFSALEDEGLEVPRNLRSRKFDLAYLDDSCKVNIEANFYGGGGSKPQEIIDAYIDRQRQLRESGWRFILVTDGAGWLAGRNQLRRGIQDLDFLMNLNFVRAGLLQAAIERCYK